MDKPPVTQGLFQQVAGNDAYDELVRDIAEGFEMAVLGLLEDDVAGPVSTFQWVDDVALSSAEKRWAAVRQALAVTSQAQQALGTTSTWKIPSEVMREIEAQIAVGPEQQEGVRDALYAAQSYVFDMSGVSDTSEQWRHYGTAECPASQVAGFLMALVMLNAWQMKWWAEDSRFSAAQLWAGFYAML